MGAPGFREEGQGGKVPSRDALRIMSILKGMLAQFSWLLQGVPLDTIPLISNLTHPATLSFPVFKQPTRYLSVPFLRMAGITVSSRSKLKNNHHCECSCS